jgi:hypothetical protein
MTTSGTASRPSPVAPIQRQCPKSAVLRLRLTRADKAQIRKDAKKLGCAMSTLVLALYREGRTALKELAS